MLKKYQEGIKQQKLFQMLDLLTKYSIIYFYKYEKDIFYQLILMCELFVFNLIIITFVKLCHKYLYNHNKSLLYKLGHQHLKFKQKTALKIYNKIIYTQKIMFGFNTAKLIVIPLQNKNSQAKIQANIYNFQIIYTQMQVIVNIYQINKKINKKKKRKLKIQTSRLKIKQV